MQETSRPPRAFPMPQTRWGRTLAGWALVFGGLLGFLPILGFWMVPLGLYVLSRDSARVRRARRRLTVHLGRRFGGTRVWALLAR